MHFFGFSLLVMCFSIEDISLQAGMKLLCSILSLPTPCKEIVTPGEEVSNMTNRPMPDYFEQRTLQKLLLIGYHQSGTSTIFKQVRLWSTI